MLLVTIIVAAEPRLALALIVLGVIALILWLVVKGSGRYRTLEASELASLLQNVRQMSGP